MLSGRWLTGAIINTAQMLIKKAYPVADGFQDVLLGQTLGFEVKSSEFIQVLHTGRGHWLTISTIGCHWV